MDDRLSSLSDQLLRRILHFAPSKESASTSVLSRRWRSLSRSSGAVNLAVRAVSSPSWSNAFARAAKAALDAASEAPVTRITLRVDTWHDRASIHEFLHCSGDWRSTSVDVDLVRDVLSHPAALRVEVLHLALVESPSTVRRLGGTEAEPNRGMGIYMLVSLPSWETLRVLDLTRCDLKPSAPAAFPRLETFRLRLCSVHPKDLQDIFDAAPELATVHLESVFFTLHPIKFSQYHDTYCSRFDDDDYTNAPAETPVASLRFRAAVTKLVLAWCGKDARDCYGKRWAIDIDAPRLGSLVYKGRLRRFSLRSPELARVDLYILNAQDTSERYQEDKSDDKEAVSVLFWEFLRNFTNARALKLKVDYYLNKEILAVGDAKLLSVFPYAERLELDGVHLVEIKAPAVAIANLLDCCPVVRDLVLKLSTWPPECLIGTSRLDYNKSIDHFTRRSKKARRNAIEDSSGADRDDDVPDIPGLSGRSFACLESSLRKVSLEFRVDDEPISSLGLQLVKFFAENAMALEEMSVDAGNRRLYEHLNFINVSTKTRFEHRNLAEGSCKISRIPSSLPLDSTTDHGRTTSGFTLLPLQRRTRMV
ncbi:unnamed protein product [Urochloa decumbens]|uniref:F-box domain-containing protein n=1 Tax=Urochloa decumbens TaxID=240449 RepID=A0ABC8WCP5_9POAL